MLFLGLSYKSLSKDTVEKLVVRCLISFAAMIFQYTSMKYLPLGLVQSVQNTVPILTFGFGYFMLREKIKIKEVGNMIVSFCGILIIVVASDKASMVTNSSLSDTLIFLAMMMNLISAVILAINNVLVR